LKRKLHTLRNVRAPRKYGQELRPKHVGTITKTLSRPRLAGIHCHVEGKKLLRKEVNLRILEQLH